MRSYPCVYPGGPRFVPRQRGAVLSRDFGDFLQSPQEHDRIRHDRFFSQSFLIITRNDLLLDAEYSA
jgi:hypothetical protein